MNKKLMLFTAVLSVGLMAGREASAMSLFGVPRYMAEANAAARKLESAMKKFEPQKQEQLIGLLNSDDSQQRIRDIAFRTNYRLLMPLAQGVATSLIALCIAVPMIDKEVIAVLPFALPFLAFPAAVAVGAATTPWVLRNEWKIYQQKSAINTGIANILNGASQPEVQDNVPSLANWVDNQQELMKDNLARTHEMYRIGDYMKRPEFHGCRTQE